MTRRQFIRILFFSDTHCGCKTGLVDPPNFSEALRPAQEERWASWLRLKKHGPFHVLVNNGDAIDGKGTRMGGAEMVADPLTQVDWAYTITRPMVTKGVTKYLYLTGGTSYHVKTPDGSIDLEAVLADKYKTLVPNVRYRPRNYIYCHLKGAKHPFRILCRHETSKGTSRNGGAGPGIIRTTADLMMETQIDGAPDFDMAVYSHVHEFWWMERFIKKTQSKLYATSTPALQGAGTDFGLRLCKGTTNFGALVVELEVNKHGGWDVGHTEVIDVLDCDKHVVTHVNGNELVTL